ncbi:MAG: hypothetical protein IJ011_04905 [Clostridia bacterium]|nr:hypothetical protein [Clostridia bacterium]MBQ8849651.1 hypothetical protein [Clostridia bacterium]
MKGKKKFLRRLIVLVMTLLTIIGTMVVMPVSTSAATNRAGVYMLYGTYNIGDGNVSGYLDRFGIQIGTSYFRDDASTTTKYNYATYDWTYFTFYIHAGDIDEHTSFKLTRNGSTYTSKSLSGDGSGYLYQGSLSDGDYVLTYVGEYWSGIFTKKTYTFTYHFTVDTTAPSVSLTAGGSYISSGSYTNKAIKFSASDSYSTCKIYYKSPGSSSYTYTTSSSKSVSALTSNNGWWYFYASDGYQSSSTYSVYLDTVYPVGKISNSSGTTLLSGSYTNKPVKYTATDSGGISYYQVLTPTSSSWSSYSSGTALSSSHGWYYFRAVDKAGNASGTSSVYYDATAPYGTLYGGTSAKSSGSYTNASYIKYQASDSHSGISSCYVLKPGSSSYVSYTNGSQLTAEGTYYFYCVDRSGNQSSVVSITLDRTLPTAQLYVDGDPISSGSYTNGEYISFESNGNCYVKLPNSTSFSEYVSGTEYDKSGKYVFYATDAAGNNTGEYSIVIDRTAKTVTLDNVFDGKTDGDVRVYWKDGDADVYAPITSVTVNGKDISNGDRVYTIATGEYEVSVTDAAGNTWSTSFVSSKKNILNDTLQKEYYEATDINGDVFSFETYDSAFAFAIERENLLVSKGTWSSSVWDTGIPMDAKDSVNAVNGEYYIYKKSGKPDETVAYFTLERLGEVIAEYAADGIKSYYYWQKTPATQGDGENLYRESDGGTLTVNSVILGENIGVLLDGKEFTGSVIETEGKHTVTVYDSFGNSRDYTVTIVRNTPDILYAVGEGTNNSISFDRTYYFKDEVRFLISDTIDTFAMFRILDENGNIVAIRSVGESYTITESGSYTVISINHAGDSQPLKLVISRNAPTVDMNADDGEKRLIITVTPSKDRESHIQSIEILKSADGGSTWQTLTEDDYGTAVTLERTVYEFRTSGLYKVTVTDEFRTGMDAVVKQLDYTQPLPAGTLEGVTNGGYTNSNVTFAWTDEAIVSVTKNGETIEYNSGDVLNENGAYTIIFENHDGNRAEYRFVIDKIKPEIAVEGARSDMPVNTPVTVSFTENGLTAIIIKDGTESPYISGTAVTEHGQYTIRVTDRANNVSETSFTIDKEVEYTVNVHNESVSTSVILTVNEDAEVLVYKNGELIEYETGAAITEPADYLIKLTDAFGNTEEIAFTIVPSVVQKLEYNFDNVEGFEKILVNGEDKRLNYGTLELLTDGTYEVSVIASGVTHSFSVTVDATAPTLTLDGVDNGGTTKKSVTLTDMSDDATIQVFLDDLPIDYEMGDELEDIGIYKVVLTDEAGNVTEYSFEILWKMPAAAIVLIVVAVLGVVGVVVWMIISGKRKKEYYS